MVATWYVVCYFIFCVLFLCWIVDVFVVVSCFNFVFFSKLVGGGELKVLLLEISIARSVSSVLPPTKVTKLPV